MEDPLTIEEKLTLLKLAREALEYGVKGQVPPALDPLRLTPRLTQPGASFVTLTIDGDLRGCIGAMEPVQALAEDVRAHAIAAALEDPRFMPVQPEELTGIHVEVSRLTLPEELEYVDAIELFEKLRPGVDGVILRDGARRATFLPQVWDKIPDKGAFLEQLCAKMGVMPDAWRQRHMLVQTYQVEEFHE